MPESIKNLDGSTKWIAIFSAIAASVVLILQQWQTYRVAELKTEAEVTRVNFLAKEEVDRLSNSIKERLSKIEHRVSKLEEAKDKKYDKTNTN